MLMGEAWPEELIDVRIADRMRLSLDELRRTPAPDVMDYLYVLKGESEYARYMRAQQES